MTKIQIDSSLLERISKELDALKAAMAEPQDPDSWGAGYEAGYAAGVAEHPAEPVREPYTGDVTRIMRDAGMNFHLGLPQKRVIKQMTRVIDLVYAEASVKTARQFVSAPPHPAEPFSQEAISATQTAWKMGYNACKEEKATQPSTLPPIPKNLHSLAGMIWPRIIDLYDAEAGEEKELAEQKIHQAIEEHMQAYAREALRLNGVNV